LSPRLTQPPHWFGCQGLASVQLCQRTPKAAGWYPTPPKPLGQDMISTRLIETTFSDRPS
jgi:hypothetical protein